MLLIEAPVEEAIPIVAEVITIIVTDPSQLTASDALKIANRRRTFDGETECHRVMASIQRAASKGNREVETVILTAPMQTILTNLGYTFFKKSLTSYLVTW